MTEFLVLYDYGMGGVWGFATAGSAEEIKGAFPELEIIAEKPVWMDAETEAKIREVSSFVVGDEATYPKWLNVG